MTIRELLQIEIWSKRTTRKILIGFGIVAVGLVDWFAINKYWITPPERNAARAALAQIDLLQNFAQMDDAEYDTRVLKAKGNIDAAKEAAFTSRDEMIAAELGIYLLQIDVERSDQKRIPSRYYPEQPLLVKKTLEMNRILLTFGLHRALD
jgi:type II secretory pathway component PulM